MTLFGLDESAPVVKIVRATHFDNPLNVVLVFVIVSYLYSFWPKAQPTDGPVTVPNKATSYNWRPDPNRDTIVWRKWTPQELRAYDGTEKGAENGRILFAIRRKVYDVTAGRSFYGPGGPYAIFAGRDATRGMAKQSFEADMLTPVDEPIDQLDDLTPSEWTNLLDWESHFKAKYFVCGDLIESSDAR